MSWPSTLHKSIIDTFANEKKGAYGQIATVSSNHHPSVRTVHIHAFTEPENILLISTNIKSKKWTTLKTNPWIGGCYWDADHETQFRFEGKTELITDDHPIYANLVDLLWQKTRKEVRIAYLLDDRKIDLKTKDPNVNPEEHSKNHGVILIRPTRWDIFHNDPKIYRMGTRTIYELRNNNWENRDVTSLHED